MTSTRLSPDLAAAVEADVLALAADLVGRPLDAPAALCPLHDLGFDSMRYVELSGLINECYGLDLAPTLFFDVHTPRAIAAHLVAEHADAVARRHGIARLDAEAADIADTDTDTACDAPPRAPGGDIAIVGMAGVLPQSADLDAFWAHLLAGDDLIAEVPPGRWNWRDAGADPATRWGGFAPRVDCFDAAFFGISPREAEQMDPQQRLLLQTAWAALEDAALRPSDLLGSDAAIFVGASTADYLTLLPAADGHLAIGNAHAMLANRLSYLLGTHGPSEAVDTACSSSLVALHRAVQALRRGESRVAIVGGVNLMFTSRLHRALAAAGMLSPDGRCKTFDASANGYVRGEGVIALVLMPLEDARAQRRPVLALVKGSAVNHGGRAAFLTAPDVNAQAALLEAAYLDAGVDPASVGYVEAHGTGTALGDPVEVQALRQGFAAAARRGPAQATPARCGIGSVKSNIGHLEAAAGLAGVAKVVLAMRHRVLPASLHCRELNPYLKLDADRFHVVTEPTPWRAADGLPPRAGVSSFGFGGANAHVVLEAAPAGEPGSAPSHAGPWFVPLSARSERALRARIAQLAAWLDAVDSDDAPLPALAKTLTLGRETMPHRFGITCTSLDDLRAQLAAAQARRPTDGATPHAAPQAGWLAGDDAPLPAAWHDATPLLRLPAYPFDATRHWPDALSAPAAVELMPIGDGAFQVRLDPAQPLVADHWLAGEPVLAAAAQIVFARRAFEADSGDCANVTLRDVEWLAPVTVGASTEVRIVVTRHGGARAHVALGVAATGGAVSSRGEASHAPAAAECGAVDLDTIRARCRQAVTAGACYDAFAERGIDYGPSFRPLAGLAVGQDEVLADFDPEALAALDGDAREVALLDGAFQAISGLHVANAQRIDAGWLPAALARIDWHGEMADARHAWICAVAMQAGRGTFDITLCAGDGTPRASLRGFTLASRQAAAARAGQRLDGAGDHLLAPAWLPVPASGAAHRAATLTVLGGSAAQRATLAATNPPPRVIDSIDALDETDAHVVWFASDDVAATMPDTADAGLAGFRLVKRLLALGAGARPLSLTVLTVRAWSLPGDPPAFPANADLAGLCGSLANEYPHWRIRVIDLPAGDALPQDWLTQDAPTGQPLLLHRHGQWFARGLVPLAPPPADTPPYRPDGVYVVIGGAGGLGRVWTEHVLRSAGAQVVWLGRRPRDAALDAHCAALAAHGPQPIYLSADAGDEAALRAARDTVLARFGRIDGVVHAAIVLRDGSLAQQDDAQFGAALHAQVATTQNLARVFGAQPLDFLLFFSSLQSTFVAAGQGNYAAGCTFRDAFADWLRTQVTYPVKIVNWGFWGHTGVVATEAYRQRMAALGIGSIEPAAAMAALDGLLSGPLDQAAYLTTLGPVALPSLAADLAGRVAPRTEALGRRAPTLPDEADDSSWQAATAALERAIAERLFAELAALRAFDAPTFDLDTVLGAARIAPPYRRWCAQTLALLARHGALEWDGRRGRTLAAAPASGAARAAWRDARVKLDAGNLLGAHLALVEATLDALPAILQGRVPATSILFPDGDMHRVEAVYRRNAQADRCNRAVVDVVAQLLDDAPDARPAALLEIGAGTGGTTVPLLDALDARRARLEHYDFTDLSRAFLLNAERSFGQGRDWLSYHLFDVEAALAPQALPSGSYDIVLATNVLHATQDIDVTLRNAKALLKTGGYLVINELLETHCFAHATFGLLAGWWRHRDSSRRLPGSPLLSRDGWTRALREAGFAVLAPASPDAQSQGVIVAVSDGVIVQPTDAPVPAPAAVAAATRPTAAPEGAAHGADLRARCLHWLTQLVARTLKMPAGQLAADRPLGGYGVDSILVIGLTKSLRETFDIPLSNATLFEHATLDALTDFLVGTHRAACERVLGAAATAPAPRSEAPPARDLASSGAAVVSAAAPRGAAPAGEPMPIAVIGMSGRYAQADDLHAFWAHLRDGRHCITEVPADRWDWRTHFDPEKGVPGRTYSRWGGFLTQIDRFDAGFFRIAPNDAAQIDPQARLFLEESWAAIEDAGYTPASLAANRQVGVFVGAMNGYYPTGAQFWGIANRVSHLLDFHGPSLAVDTACSSSLTALHLAIESLRAGGCECAIAGGVNLITSPRHLVGLSSLTMLSAGDTCRAFGAGADGFVDGEGVGALVLKPLARAVEDGDAIHGVIRGSAINAGGKTHGLTVPNPRAQQAVVEAALARSGVPARALSYIEAHGTGTALGDPIELAGLTRAFAAHTAERGFCALGSVKSNIGHTESAAGIAGVTKVLLQMKHRELVPTLHADEVNPDVDFSATPFTLQHRLQAWAVPDGQARLAGVSSFGAGGANAHVVLEEFVEQRALGDDTPHPALVVLSAATEGALRQRAARLLAALERGEIAPRRLRDLAFTLQTGRVEMAWRFACVATSTDALRATLAAYLARNNDARWHAHHVDPARPGLRELDSDPELRASIVAQCVAAGKFDKLAALWSQGLGLDWRALARDTAPRARLHLPTYPFEGERHWLDEPGDRSAARARAPLAETDIAVPADAPRDVGTVLRGIVAQVLGYPDVALSESFFSLGGDSIRAARAHRRLQQSLGIEIPLSLLLDAGTLAECVTAIEALPAAVPADVPVAHDARPSALSSHQQQFFFLDRLNPGNPAFNLPGALRVDGPWHGAAFEAAYQALIDAHDVLRTRFVVHDGEPRAEVVAHRRATVERHDLSALLPAHQAARIDACLTDASRTGFVLEQGDLSRVAVLELGDEAHIVLMNLHHIVGDMVSLATLLRTLAQAAQSGVAPTLPRPRRQYADWAADEQAQLPARVARALPYWLDRLHHLPRPLPLPCDRPRPPVPSYRGRSVPLAFPPELAARLDAFCRERNLSRFVVTLAAFKVVLRVLSGQDDIVVGSPYANRADEDSADMIGCLAYALVMRTRLDACETFDDAIARVRQTVLGAFDHQGVPYPRLVEALNPTRHSSANPLYQVMFNVIPMPDLPGGVTPLEVDSGWLDYDLFVRLFVADDTIRGVLQYSEDLFDRRTADDLAAYYADLLHTLLAYPSLPLAGLAAPASLAAPARTIGDAVPPLQLEIASTFTDRPLASTLRYWGQVAGQPLTPNFAPYGQLFQTLYDPSSPFRANRHGMNVVLVRARDWLRFDADATDTRAQLALYVDELADALHGSAPAFTVPTLVLVLPDDAAALAHPDGDDAGHALKALLAGLPGLDVVHWRELAEVYPVVDVFDPHADAAGHVPFTAEYYAAIASYVARTAFQRSGLPLGDAWNRLAAEIRDDAQDQAAAPSAHAARQAAPYAPPRDDADATLLAIFADALKTPDLGIDDHFFDRGGHSILAINVVYRINDAFDASLSVADVFMAPTVRQLAARMQEAPRAPDYVDLATAAVLPDDLAPLGAPVADTPRGLLLTGATGFVGRHLLRELLDRTDATIYCLVRAADAAQGAERLRRTLDHWSLWRPDTAARIVAVPGDLSRPRLGLSDADHARLCDAVDAIYHNGTSMNHLESFEMARRANVDGVIDLLRIAVTGRPKTFNYVSTLGVFSMEERLGEHVFTEASPIDGERHLASHGYTTSKWAGEHLTHLAAARGVPCNVFRLGLVTGDTEHGHYDPLQSYYRLLKSCMLMGAAFDDFRYDLVITPVDYVAKALAHLGAKHMAGGKVFHLSSMQVTPMHVVFEMMNRQLAAPMRMLSHSAWLDALRTRYRQGDVLPIVPVVQWMMNLSPDALAKLTRDRHATTMIYDCTATQRELDEAGIVVPTFDDVLLRRYLRGMCRHDDDLRPFVSADGDAFLHTQL
ncbi:thioester reductase domain-containing protein [Burkholderia ubonensis]|uniref:thioester reductase domain-containing protein n=1 Tax=Burkholderia ubonensis TaxID=101571 RepID=UPI00075FC13E|nr:thioester reductase domain-containing protein [Burkholderia ubonensis]KWO66295.1 polyketide synthase [Burkholderia ubonensis]